MERERKLFPGINILKNISNKPNLKKIQKQYFGLKRKMSIAKRLWDEITSHIY